MEPVNILLLPSLLFLASTEAFFLPSLASVLQPSFLPRLHPRAQLGLRTHRQPRKQTSYSQARPHYPFNTAPTRPHYPPNTAPARPHHPLKVAPFAPRLQDPGAKVKLDYSGWTAMGFDDSLPSKRVRSAPAFTPRIVTLEEVIAAAPPAQSDDLLETAYHQPSPAQLHQVYEEPTPAPSYQPPSHSYQPSSLSYQHLTSKYRPPSSLAAVPAVPYIPTTPQHSTLEYNNPAVAPRYSPPTPQQYEAVPSHEAPSLPPKFRKTTPALTYFKPSPNLKDKSKFSNHVAEHKKAMAHNTSTNPVTRSPEVVLPAFTPAPPVYSKSQDSPTNQYPIVAIITADSDVPEEQKYVSFSIGGADNGGSPDSLPSPEENQATGDNTRLAKDITEAALQQEELFYIYYKDAELDPSYGLKIQNTRSIQEVTLHNSAPLQDLPIYDYDEATEPESFRRIERNQTSYRTARQQPDLRGTSRYRTDFGDSSSSSRSFNS